MNTIYLALLQLLEGFKASTRGRPSRDQLYFSYRALWMVELVILVSGNNFMLLLDITSRFARFPFLHKFL